MKKFAFEILTSEHPVQYLITLEENIEYSDQIVDEIIEYAASLATEMVIKEGSDIWIPTMQNKKTIKGADQIKKINHILSGTSLIRKWDFTNKGIDFLIEAIESLENDNQKALECVLFLKDLTYMERLFSYNIWHGTPYLPVILYKIIIPTKVVTPTEITMEKGNHIIDAIMDAKLYSKI